MDIIIPELDDHQPTFQPGLFSAQKLPQQCPVTCEEFGAILWLYTAAFAVQIPAEIVFHPDGYKGDSEWLIERFENKNCFGLPLLPVWDFAVLRKMRMSDQNFLRC